jgi:hypothetical protein
MYRTKELLSMSLIFTTEDRDFAFLVLTLYYLSQCCYINMIQTKRLENRRKAFPFFWHKCFVVLYNKETKCDVKANII